jgi:hypothetical protein
MTATSSRFKTEIRSAHERSYRDSTRQTSSANQTSLSSNALSTARVRSRTPNLDNMLDT